MLFFNESEDNYTFDIPLYLENTKGYEKTISIAKSVFLGLIDTTIHKMEQLDGVVRNGEMVYTSTSGDFECSVYIYMDHIQLEVWQAEINVLTLTYMNNIYAGATTGQQITLYKEGDPLSIPVEVERRLKKIELIYSLVGNEVLGDGSNGT